MLRIDSAFDKQWGTLSVYIRGIDGTKMRKAGVTWGGPNGIWRERFWQRRLSRYMVCLEETTDRIKRLPSSQEQCPILYCNHIIVP